MSNLYGRFSKERLAKMQRECDAYGQSPRVDAPRRRVESRPGEPGYYRPDAVNQTSGITTATE